MITYDRFQLDNGLTVLVHEDDSTPMVAVNILYKVGSRDESPQKTGFAHLFEHLMFGGSLNIPDFDSPLQWAGGDSNAFTNNDITNFYVTIPAENLETVFWLESDRMMSLNFSPDSLETQRKVVLEEFKETCLNQPYGDVWHHISSLAYEVHPYGWPTIGKIPKHIEDATLDDVKEFFFRFYRPNNAVLVVAGRTNAEEVRQLAEKWFGDIPAGKAKERLLPQEPKQAIFKHSNKIADVPMNAIYMAFHVPERTHPDYYAINLLSDILCHGYSSRLYRRLLKEQQLFSDIDCYITGSIDPGLFIIEGKPLASMEAAKIAIWKEIEALKDELIPPQELEMYKNKNESSLTFTEANILYKAMNLAYFEMIGDADRINREVELYQAVSVFDIQRVAKEYLTADNCSELFYIAKSKNEQNVTI